MPEERWGEKWLPGMRVRVWNRHERPGHSREGVIVDRSWGRDRGRAIYWFAVQIDGVEGAWIFGPGELQETAK